MIRVEAVRPVSGGLPLVEVALTGGEVLRLHERRLAGGGLAAGTPLTPDELDGLRRLAAADAAERRALRLIARRPRSRAELADRLAGWGLDGVAVSETLARLERFGLMDDRALAGAVADQRRREGHGRLRVAADLRRLALDPAAAAEALEPADGEDGELARARRELDRRFGGRPADPPGLARAAGHLARRGFDPDTVAEALGLDPGC
jgi:regulatory protein